MKRALGFALTAALVLACADQLPTDVQTAISDGAHGDEAHPGNPDFFFLPPMVANPSGHPDFEAGAFNGSLAPTVEICVLAETEAADITAETPCVNPQPSGFPIVYTTTTGPGSETIRVNGAEEHYSVNWHTNEFSLSTSSFYRIWVKVGTFVLGFADVDVVSNGSQLKNVQTGELIGLVDNRTLPIKFRIEEDALCTAEPGEECNASSETVDLGDDVPDQVDLRDETTGEQIGVLTIPPQDQPPEGGQVTFTIQECEQLDVDIPQFGDCLRITADPPLTDVVPDGLFPPATISLCRAELIGPQNDLITVHRQDEETGEVFALPHVDDDCEDIIGGPGQQSPNWDVGQQPAGDSPFTSLFRSALPAKMDYVLASDAERTAPAGAELPTAVLVTDANNAPVANARVTFTVTDGDGDVGGSTETAITTGADGLAQVTWTLGETAAANMVQASGRGIASLGNDGPADGFDPFWPGLHEEGVDKPPVLLGEGTLEFAAHPNGVGVVMLAEGGSVDLRDEQGRQIGVLTIPPQEGFDQEIRFTLEQCEQLDVDIPQFGDCLRITADPPLTDVVPDGLFPPATISLCRLGLTEPQNDLITIHRQDEETSEVFALPHVDDDCEDIIPGPGQQSPNWDVGQQPAGDSPLTSLFRNALPVQMDALEGTDGQTAAPGQAVAVPPGVLVTDRAGAPAAGATVHFEVTAGEGGITPVAVMSNASGVAQITSWQLGAAGENVVRAFGKGIAGPDAEPFMPDLPTDEGPGPQVPVLLETGTLAFTATALAGPTGSITIDFDRDPAGLSVAPGTIVNSVYTSQGVTFAKVPAGPAVCGADNNVYANSNGPLPGGGFGFSSGQNSVTVCSGSTASDFNETSFGVIRATLAAPASKVCIDVAPTTEGGWGFLEALTSTGTVLTRVTSTPGAREVLCATAAGIAVARFAGDGTQFAIFDNFFVDFSSTPSDGVVIDGSMNSGEWDGAAMTIFTANVPGGTTRAVLFVKNDATNLYLAVRFLRSVVDAGNLLNFEFDNNNNGTGPENGDDYITFSFGSNPNAGVFSDAYRSGGGTTVTNDGVGHGAAAFTNDATFSVYEMSHPLNSGESGQDFALTSPTVIGMLVQLTVGSAHTVYPAGVFPTYVPINITSP